MRERSAYDPWAHADVPGSKKCNQKLSERAAALVKSYPVSQGAPADVIEIRAEGKEQQLDENRVGQLHVKDRGQCTRNRSTGSACLRSECAVWSEAERFKKS